MTDAQAGGRGVQVEVANLPAWVDAQRLLGLPGFELLPAEGGRVLARGQLPRRDAADVAARLRGVGLDGQALQVSVSPPLPRAAVRAARTVDARRRRDTSVGFSRGGTRLDEQGRFSLTPEALALRIGRDAMAAGLVRVLDAGCGAGGNAIGFARAGCEVCAVERDPARLAMARHNAGVYGAAQRIAFEVGDALERARSGDFDLIFVDPPWGPDWDRTCTGAADFPLLQALHSQRAPGPAGTQQRRPALWAKLPPSFDFSQLPGATPAAVFGEAAGDRNRVKFVLAR